MGFFFDGNFLSAVYLSGILVIFKQNIPFASDGFKPR